jgi:HAD superfamily hydrolase (TIGR01509 family)
MNNKYTVFIDCGDTLADESTQIYIEGELVKSADLIPGAKELILALKEKGYSVALVADGVTQSFQNIMNQHDLWDKFDCHIISEEVGVCKPHQAMFRTAADVLGIKDEDFPFILMVGNNLSRDVKGANALGIKSVFQSWSPRYPKKPADPSEKPDYIIERPLDLLLLLEKLETELPSSASSR